MTVSWVDELVVGVHSSTSISHQSGPCLPTRSPGARWPGTVFRPPRDGRRPAHPPRRSPAVSASRPRHLQGAPRDSLWQRTRSLFRSDRDVTPRSQPSHGGSAALRRLRLRPTKRYWRCRQVVWVDLYCQSDDRQVRSTRLSSGWFIRRQMRSDSSSVYTVDTVHLGPECGPIDGSYPDCHVMSSSKPEPWMSTIESPFHGRGRSSTGGVGRSGSSVAGRLIVRRTVLSEPL